jgi:hypothetical protein
MIGRREFMAGLRSAVAWPLVALAQQAAVPVVGVLILGSRPQPSAPAPFMRAFRMAGRAHRRLFKSVQ